MRPLAPLALLLLTLAGCGGSRAVMSPDAAPIRPADTPGARLLADESAAIRTARARLGFLASDELEGRETGMRGNAVAAQYLANQLRIFGVEPGGDLDPTSGSRTYFHQLGLRTMRFDTTVTRLADPSGKLGPLTLGRDWIALPEYTADRPTETLGVVFAGYGASTLPGGSGHDDYDGIDAKGKLVVVLGGKASGADSLRTPMGNFDLGRADTKWLLAAFHGAAGVMIVQDTQVSGDWPTIAPVALGVSMKAASDTTDPMAALPPLPLLFASEAFGAKLLAALGAPTSALADAKAGRPLAARESDLKLTVGLKLVRGTAQTADVVGWLPGDGSTDEVIGMGAHFDHNGVVGGQIYNGADDDGSGTVTVLDVAEALARDRAAGQPTKRSILIAFHTGEEKGLLGSESLASQPERTRLGAIDRMAAMVNIDMVGREAPDSLYTVGSARLSTGFGRLVDGINLGMGANGRPLFAFNRTYDAPNDPEHIYERSDHYSYAKRGVPIVFFTDGMGANWRKNSPADDYHRPTDDVDKIDFAKMTRVTRLVYAVVREAADRPERPVVDHPVAPESAE